MQHQLRKMIRGSMFLLTDVEKVKQTATMIWNEFNEINPFTSWPPPAEEIKADNIIIPELLETFLKSVLTKDNSISTKISRLVKSLGQDIIYNATNGRIKTIKHVQLGMFTKRKTGSKLLINCLRSKGTFGTYVIMT